MLDLDQYIVKEHVGLFKLTDTYDILDPATGRKVGQAQEKVAGWMHVLRILINKQMLPTRVSFIADPDEHGNGTEVLAISRGFSFLRPKIRILANGQTEIGYFKAKLFSFGGTFFIHDTQDKRIGEVKGDWKGWNFTIRDDAGKELGVITKKWAGLGKELFTSADTYVISINKDTATGAGVRSLLLAAGLAIDTVFKEKG